MSDPPRTAVRFGTSGWRGVLGEGFTLERARAVAAALARRVAGAEPGARVLVAHDRRFLADRVAREAARVLRAAGARPLRVAEPIPTPVAAHALRRRECRAGLLVTASHNPPEYLGIKILTDAGASAPEAWTRWLEAETAAQLAAGPPAEAEVDERPIRPLPAYLSEVGRSLDREALAHGGLRVAYDALHGTGAGVLDRLLTACGVPVVLTRGEVDPGFGGGAPDPTPERLARLARTLRDGGGFSLGLATDGDADRFAALDERGRRLSETQALALLVDHLARTRALRGGVAISVATGSLVERVAAEAGLEVERHPIGFKWLSESLVAGRAAVAGEESGGFAWAPLAHDKDGILAGALLAEVAAHAGGAPSRRLAVLERRHGRSACGREALPLTPALGKALERLAEAPPARFDGSRAEATHPHECLRLELADGFLLLRLSDTEPVLRVYAEARSRRALSGRLRAARGLLERAAR